MRVRVGFLLLSIRILGRSRTGTGGKHLRRADPQEPPDAAWRIPNHLFLTGAYDGLSDIPEQLKENINNTLEVNTGMPYTYFDDNKCLALLQRFNNGALENLFNSSTEGKYRSDICRAVYLYENGGFYVDLDFELLKPLTALVYANTSFMSVWTVTGDVLNALMGVAPKSTILQRTINLMTRYTDFQPLGPDRSLPEPSSMDEMSRDAQPAAPSTPQGLGQPPLHIASEVNAAGSLLDAVQTFRAWGPRLLHLGLLHFLYACNISSAEMPSAVRHTSDFSACNETIRMLDEVDMQKQTVHFWTNRLKKSFYPILQPDDVFLGLNGSAVLNAWRAEDRMQKGFSGLRYGVFDRGESLVGYPRFFKCKNYGCTFFDESPNASSPETK